MHECLTSVAVRIAYSVSTFSLLVLQFLGRVLLLLFCVSRVLWYSKRLVYDEMDSVVFIGKPAKYGSRYSTAVGSLRAKSGSSITRVSYPLTVSFL